MVELVLHGRPVATVFDLLGRDENDMTYALGWGLSHASRLLRGFVDRVAPGAPLEAPIVITLQEHDRDDAGFTDIEILSADLHVIVEAKRGWAPPSEAQLRRYEARFAAAGRPRQCLVILTQNGVEPVVRRQIGPWRPPAPVEALVVGWSELVTLARTAGGGPLVERRLTRELAAYLASVADRRNTDSNSVYVVSIANGSPDGWPEDLTWMGIVTTYGRYFYPASGGGWPRTPPNYVAFRWGGQLQSIHHVDAYAIFTDPHEAVPDWPSDDWAPHFLLTLGPAIIPSRPTRTGTGIFRSARVWADIDLLLTSATITEAHQRTRERRAG